MGENQGNRNFFFGYICLPSYFWYPNLGSADACLVSFTFWWTKLITEHQKTAHRIKYTIVKFKVLSNMPPSAGGKNSTDSVPLHWAAEPCQGNLWLSFKLFLVLSQFFKWSSNDWNKQTIFMGLIRPTLLHFFKNILTGQKQHMTGHSPTIILSLVNSDYENHP